MRGNHIDTGDKQWRMGEGGGGGCSNHVSIWDSLKWLKCGTVVTLVL